MTPQTLALWLFFALAAVAVAAFVVVARSGRNPGEVSYEAAAKMRKRLFYGLTVALVAFFALTLPRMPYPKDGVRPDRVVHVRARQFLFEFSGEGFPADGTSPTGAPLEPVKAGELVEYRVSSADATHSFAIYDLNGDLMTQVQAMPGYVNRLRVRFPESGTYQVLCLEYCGVAHHLMRSTIQVAAAE